MRSIIDRPTQDQRQSGNAMSVAVVLSFTFISLSLTLLTSVDINRKTVDGNIANLRARHAALSGMTIAIDQINESLIRINPRIEQTQAGNLSGVARSMSDPAVQKFYGGGTTGNNVNYSGIHIREQSIESTIKSVAIKSGPSSEAYSNVSGKAMGLESQADILKKEDGWFSVRAIRLDDGSWRVHSRGKWGPSVRRIVTILTPDDGRPFRIGIYGTDGVFVSGPGTIDWINTANPNDNVIPSVLESGAALTVTKERQ